MMFWCMNKQQNITMGDNPSRACVYNVLLCVVYFYLLTENIFKSMSNYDDLLFT